MSKPILVVNANSGYADLMDCPCKKWVCIMQMVHDMQSKVQLAGFGQFLKGLSFGANLAQAFDKI